jgi:hypothetical protein
MKNIMKDCHNVLYTLAIIATAALMAMAYLLPGSNVTYPMLLFGCIAFIVFVLWMAAIGADQMYRDYKLNEDEAKHDEYMNDPY